jgi:hypothetical protein
MAFGTPNSSPNDERRGNLVATRHRADTSNSVLLLGFPNYRDDCYIAMIPGEVPWYCGRRWR